MTKSVYETSDYALYTDLIDLLGDIKLTLGGEGVYYTLKHRPKLMKFLKEYQKNKLNYFESILEEVKYK